MKYKTAQMIMNLASLVCFTVLAIVFDKWWLMIGAMIVWMGGE